MNKRELPPITMNVPFGGSSAEKRRSEKTCALAPARSASHPSLPCEVLVQSLRTGKTVKVRVNDRGPFIKNRIIDLSEEAAERLDMKHHGLDKVRITVLSVGDGKWKKEAPPCATPA